jgi:hypothetical protein
MKSRMMRTGQMAQMVGEMKNEQKIFLQNPEGLDLGTD